MSPVKRFPPGARLLILFGLMLCLLPVSGVSVTISDFFSLGERDTLLVSSILQSIFAFIFPALCAGFFSGRKTLTFLGLIHSPSWKNIAGIIIVYLIGLPFLNQVIYWNENLVFPDSMAGLYEQLKQWEVMNERVSQILLNDKSVYGLISGILVIGVLTGFSEELFFRGALQTTLGETGLKKNGSVWVAAIIFSFLHFQFFGFVPRLMLGALFGYYLLSTSSLWNSVIAHALNNSLVVITVWLAENGNQSIAFEMVGVNEKGVPVIAIISGCLLVIFFKFFFNFFFKRQEGECPGLAK